MTNKKEKKEIELTPRQRAFAENYLKSGIKEEAALKAGYSPIYAKSQSYKLLDNVGIRAYIEKRSQKTTSKLIAAADEVLEFYSRGMRGETKDQFGLEATLTDRIKCADALAKRYGLLKDRLEVEDKTGSIAALLKAARERVKNNGG